MADPSTKPRSIPETELREIQAISAKIKELRKQQGYSFESFAVHAGIHRTTYFKLEHGKNINISTFLIVLRGLGITPIKFFELLTEPLSESFPPK